MPALPLASSFIFLSPDSDRKADGEACGATIHDLEEDNCFCK